MPTKTRRQKLEAMANQTVSPNEAAIAQQMLAESGTPLERIAAFIHAEWGKGLEAQFAIGHLLIEARYHFPGDSDFGKWLKAQNFGFTTKTANNLRRGAEREQEVRAFIAARKETSDRDIGVVYAMDLLAAPKPKPTAEAIPVTDTTPVDPAFDAIRHAYNVIAKVEEGEPTGNAFLTMHVDDLATSAGFIQKLAGLYGEAKNARNSK